MVIFDGAFLMGLAAILGGIAGVIRELKRRS